LKLEHHPQGKSTNWSRKPKNIPWMESLGLSSVALTLSIWTMGGNFSNRPLRQHSFPSIRKQKEMNQLPRNISSL